MASLHDFESKTLDGMPRSLGDFRDKVVLIVNVASKCGLTPQYKGLQALHADLEKRGFAVLGFPCNQFAGQEPGTPEEIQTFCETNYGTTFPMFAKVEVNGPGRDPIYKWLTTQPTSPDGSGDVQWNFAKFVVGRDGQVVGRFPPQTAPDDPALRASIEKALDAR
jgi:glutathione peroxidase